MPAFVDALFYLPSQLPVILNDQNVHFSTTSIAVLSEECLSTANPDKHSGNPHVHAKDWMEMRRMRAWMLIATAILGIAHAEVIRFDHGTPGGLPAGWTVAMTHAGGTPKWEIVRDETAPHPPMALAQVSRDATAGRFPLAVWDRATIRNGEASVAFKAVDGTIDRAAGIVWRFQDPNNYYIVRANALENNVVLYKVEAGTRLSIAPKGLPSRAYGVKHEVPSQRWNILRVVFNESLFSVFLNGEHLFDVEDHTFKEAGKVGLWTKADSVTYFADFTFVKH